MTQPDLKLRADVAVEVMGWIHKPAEDRVQEYGHWTFGVPHKGNTKVPYIYPEHFENPSTRAVAIAPGATPSFCGPTRELPRYELSLDACRDVLREIERRKIGDLLICHLVSELKIEPPLFGVDEGWDILNATPADICRAALAAVREAKETDR